MQPHGYHLYRVLYDDFLKRMIDLEVVSPIDLSHQAGLEPLENLLPL